MWLRVQPLATVLFRIVAEISKCWEHPLKSNGSTSTSSSQHRMYKRDPGSASGLFCLWPLSSWTGTWPAFLTTYRVPSRSLKLETRTHICILYVASSYSGNIFTVCVIFVIAIVTFHTIWDWCFNSFQMSQGCNAC